MREAGPYQSGRARSSGVRIGSMGATAAAVEINGGGVVSKGLIEKIRNLVADQLGVDAGELESGADILDDLGADSLDVVEMVMAIEEEFDLEIPDEDAEGMRTLGDVEKYVADRIAA